MDGSALTRDRTLTGLVSSTPLGLQRILSQAVMVWRPPLPVHSILLASILFKVSVSGSCSQSILKIFKEQLKLR